MVNFLEIDICEKEKLLRIALCIFNTYGTKAHIAQIKIIDADEDDAEKSVRNFLIVEFFWKFILNHFYIY